MCLSVAAFGFDGWRDDKEIGRGCDLVFGNSGRRTKWFGGEIAFASEMLRVEIEKPSRELCGCKSNLFEAEVLPFFLGLRMRHHLWFTNRQDIVHTLQMHHFSL
jgi:hypothetical protein